MPNRRCRSRLRRACWIALSTRGWRRMKACRCPRSSCRATTRKSSGGGASRPWDGPGGAARNCWSGARSRRPNCSCWRSSGRSWPNSKGRVKETTINLIQTLEHEEIARLGKTIPVFAPGDTVVVNVSVVEGERKRVQAYEGVVIAKKNRGLNSSFTVRKISSGEGVERTFQTYSPMIASIEVKRKGDVRRAKLYYMRARSGKSARIREKLTKRAVPETAAEEVVAE